MPIEAKLFNYNPLYSHLFLTSLFLSWRAFSTKFFNKSIKNSNLPSISDLASINTVGSSDFLLKKLKNYCIFYDFENFKLFKFLVVESKLINPFQNHDEDKFNYNYKDENDEKINEINILSIGRNISNRKNKYFNFLLIQYLKIK